MTSEQKLRDAMRRAFQLGQTYWAQADSQSYAANRRSDETRLKFEALVEETVAATIGVAPTREPSGETMVQREEVVSAWNDLPDALKAHPGLKRLYRALGGGALGDKLPNTGVKEDGRG